MANTANMTILRTTTTSQLSKRHEAEFWSDGYLEISDPAIHFAEDATGCERVCLDELEQYRLYLLLHAHFKGMEIKP